MDGTLPGNSNGVNDQLAGRQQTGQQPAGIHPAGDHPALRGLLGQWRGTTYLAAGPWGPDRTVEAEVSYRSVASGFGVVQSYGHHEPDGTRFEGLGMFTVDPDHPDVLWYRADSTGRTPGAPVRCTWHDGVLRVERHGSAGWTRHSVRLEGGVLTHVTELRTRDDTRVKAEGRVASVAGAGAEADGTGSAYTAFMTSTFSRA